MRLLPQRRVLNRPRAGGSSPDGQRFHDHGPDGPRFHDHGPDGQGPDDGAAAGQPPWLMRPAGIVAAGTAVAVAVLIGGGPALVLAETAQGAARHPAGCQAKSAAHGRRIPAVPGPGPVPVAGTGAGPAARPAPGR